MKSWQAPHARQVSGSLLSSSGITLLLLFVACASVNRDFLNVASAGNSTRLEALLRSGADIDTRDDHGVTALMVAAANGHEAAVRLLLENRAIVDATSDDGGTAIMRAAVGGHTKIVRILLTVGAKSDSRTDSGQTALMLADAAGHLETMLLLAKPRPARSTSAAVGEGEQFGVGAHKMSESAGLLAPQLEQMVDPRYTNDALSRKIEGAVELEVVIQENGLIGSVRVVRSLDLGLDLNAIRAVRQWRFTPGKLDGTPVNVLAEIEVVFSLL